MRIVSATPNEMLGITLKTGHRMVSIHKNIAVYPWQQSYGIITSDGVMKKLDGSKFKNFEEAKKARKEWLKDYEAK